MVYTSPCGYFNEHKYTIWEEGVDMSEIEHLSELQEKIDDGRVRLNKLIQDGLGKDDLLNLSCEIDDLINEYYRVFLKEKTS